ncbi:Ig-like domain-containing protein [Bradyrhizobium lupini]
MAINDGFANAPTGTPQLPNLLDSYGANRPGWNVAGVDYYAGTPQGLALKNPATISMAGVSVNTANHTITVTGSEVTLDGYDFSLNGGWGVVVQSANTKILNSNFQVGANGLKPILATDSSSNLTVMYSTLDGNNNGSVSGLIENRGSGTLTVEYSWLKNAGGDMIQMHNGGKSAGLIVEYNLIQNAGMASGAHGDYTEFMDGPFTATIMYNTTTQNGGASQGFMVEPDIGSSPGEIVSGEIGNNVFTGSVNAFTGVTVADIQNTFTVHDNYFDPSSSSSGLAFGGVRGGPNDSSSKSIYIHNVNMKTGAVLQDANAPTSPTSPTSPTGPTAPTIDSISNDSGTAGDRITNDNTLEVKGKAAAGSAVKVYDGTTQIGSTTADSSGNWDYITKVLTDAKHTLTATATNSSGQTGATSAAVVVTVDTKAPTAPTIAGNKVNSANQLVMSGNAETGSAVKVFDGTTQIGTATANSSGVWAYTSAALAVGAHSLTAKATDVAGNTSAASSVVTASITSTSPTAPTSPTSPTSPTAGTVIESAGATRLVESGDKFYLNASTGTGPTLKNHGVDFIDGSDHTWAPIGAEQTATGYQIVWKEASTGQYTAWNTDNNGNYVSHVGALTDSTSGGTVSGTSSALKSLETTFHQDLNGDGQIGSSTSTPTSPTSPTAGTVIESAGATRLVEGGDKFYLNGSTGTGPTLKQGGVDFIDGSDHTWAPIAAEKTTTGYQVVWKEASTGLYTAWNTDSNGNYVSHVSSLTGSTSGGTVSGTNSGLKSLETSFHQDLNGDGQVGTSSVATSSTSTTSLAATSSSTSSNVQTSTSGNDAFVGTTKADTFSFAANFGNDVIKDFTASGPAHDMIQFSKSVFDSFASVLSHATQSGQDVVIATGGDTLTLKNMKVGSLTNQDFHFA